MSEATERGWEEVRAELHREDPELRLAYEESAPAFLLAREILRLRNQLDISQEELARRMGTSQSFVSRLERMETSPSLETAWRAARAMGCFLELRFVTDPASASALGGLPAIDLIEALSVGQPDVGAAWQHVLAGDLEGMQVGLTFDPSEPVRQASVTLVFPDASRAFHFAEGLQDSEQMRVYFDAILRRLKGDPDHPAHPATARDQAPKNA